MTDPESPSLSWITAVFASTITFTSDRDGYLCSAPGDATNGGTTLSCEAGTLSLGSHTITATVKDPFDGVGTASINITAINTPPTVKITYPADGTAYYSGQQINLRGYAFDEEVYGYIPVSWSSNMSGPLGTSGDFWVSLPEGDHSITLTATDEKGSTATDSIIIHVQGTPGGGGYPTVQITQPSNNAVFGSDDVITFKGQATDPEDGDISTDEAFRWSSSEDGLLGTGRILQHSLSITGESTSHTITLEVTDSDENKSNHSINVTILDLQ